MLRQGNWGLKCAASQDRALKLYPGVRGQEAGDVDWKRLVAVASQRWRRFPECPRFARYVGEKVQGGGCGSRPTSKCRHPGQECM